METLPVAPVLNNSVAVQWTQVPVLFAELKDFFANVVLAVESWVDCVRGGVKGNPGDFDAHCGDCACHIGATMLLDLLYKYRSDGAKTASILEVRTAYEKLHTLILPLTQMPPQDLRTRLQFKRFTSLGDLLAKQAITVGTDLQSAAVRDAQLLGACYLLRSRRSVVDIHGQVCHRVNFRSTSDVRWVHKLQNHVAASCVQFLRDIAATTSVQAAPSNSQKPPPLTLQSLNKFVKRELRFTELCAAFPSFNVLAHCWETQSFLFVLQIDRVCRQHGCTQRFPLLFQSRQGCLQYIPASHAAEFPAAHAVVTIITRSMDGTWQEWCDTDKSTLRQAECVCMADAIAFFRSPEFDLCNAIHAILAQHEQYVGAGDSDEILEAFLVHCEQMGEASVARYMRHYMQFAFEQGYSRRNMSRFLVYHIYPDLLSSFLGKLC